MGVKNSQPKTPGRECLSRHFAERICSVIVTLLYFLGMRRKKGVTPNAEKEMTIYKKKEVRRISIEKKKQIEKDNKRNWHIFALTGRF